MTVTLLYCLPNDIFYVQSNKTSRLKLKLNFPILYQTQADFKGNGADVDASLNMHSKNK